MDDTSSTRTRRTTGVTDVALLTPIGLDELGRDLDEAELFQAVAIHLRPRARER